MTIAYRDGDSADAPALSALGTQSFVDTFGHLYQPDDLAAFLEYHSPAAWAADLANPALAIRVAEVEGEGEMIGYAKLGPLKLPVESRGAAAELHAFYVLAPWHGHGIAQRLSDWVLAKARERGAGELFLSVFTDNHRARRFYEKLGFEVIGSHKFMVGNQADDDLIMRLAL